MIVRLLTALSVLLVVAGCGGGGASSASGSGTLSVRLADAPSPDISAINVTIDRIEAHVDGQWMEVMNTPVSVNLLDLVMQDTLLASAQLPAGQYNQVRLFPSAATVTDGLGTHDVIIPSAVQTGIKLNLNYAIQANEITEILLDFNVDKSLIKQGNGQYRLQPVIPVCIKVTSGSVQGLASDGTAPLHAASVKAIYKAGSAYPLDTEVNTGSSLADGQFKVWALLPGTYQLQLSWTNPSDSSVKSAVLDNVVVTANAVTDVGTITLL